MAKNNKLVQIIAFLALFGIIIGILGTGILVMFGAKETNNAETLTPEQYEELQKMIETQSGNTINNNSGTIMTGSVELGTGSTELGTGEIDK